MNTFSIPEFDRIVGNCMSHCSCETACTRSLTEILPNSLESVTGQIWSRENSEDTLSFAGAYIHQKPYVRFEPKKENGKLRCCELGDLLVIMEEQRQTGPLYNAVLMQLKCMDTARPYTIKEGWDNEGRQLKLYTEWPKLKLAAKKFTNKDYDILPKSITPGAEYMIIAQLPEVKISIASPCNLMPQCPPSFGMFLASFVNWQTGRPIASECEAQKDDWSRLIWDSVDLIRGCKIKGANLDRLNSSLKWVGAQNLMRDDELRFEEDFSDSERDSSSDNEGFGILVIRKRFAGRVGFIL